VGPFIYALGALTTILCATVLLIRHVRVKHRLLLFSGLCFAGLAISNVLIFVDLVLVPDIDLHPLRIVMSIGAMSLLLYALIWERR